MPDPILQLNDLTVGYTSARPLVRLLCCAYDSAALIAVEGGNGSGKSTLLRTLVGDIPPLAGSVLLGGREVRTLSVRERARQISYTPSHVSVAPETLVKEFVALGRWGYQRWFGGATPQDEQAVARALSFVALEEFADRRVVTLSDGERQRVNIALAVAQEARVLLLDEPFSHLDRAARGLLSTLLQRLVHDRGCLVIYTSPDEGDVRLVNMPQ